MKYLSSKAQLLRFFLWLIAVHSFIVGLVLIILPGESLSFFGFHVIEKFFSTQGGVFHIVMSIAYVLAAENLGKSDLVIYFSISAKFIATIFLFSYFLFKNIIWVVAFSGAGDLIMGILLLILFINYKKELNAQEG
jgi:hypothetical protein